MGHQNTHPFVEPESLQERVIKPGGGWFDIDLEELVHYQGLIWLLVRRDFVSTYKQTVLGPSWFVVKPILTTLAFVLVFGRIAEISTDGLPQFLFYLSGNVVWFYFADMFLKVSNFFINNAKLFNKVYFPRLVVPISILISTFFVWLLQFLMFLSFLAFYRLRGVNVEMNSLALMTPILLLLVAALGLGFGIFVAALTVKYRDLSFLLSFGIQLLMYATPVIYPMSTVPEKYRQLLLLNPLTPIMEAFRYSFLGQGSFTWPRLGFSAVFILVIFIAGLAVFNRVEKTFVDLI